MSIKIIVEPIKTSEYNGSARYEQVLLKSENGYPIGLAHVDLFHGLGMSDDIYLNGTKMEGEIVFLEGGDAVR